MTFPHVRTSTPVRRVVARGLAATITGLLAGSVLTSVPATALSAARSGSLQDQQRNVKGKLHKADTDLDESSALVRKATEALLQARSDLANAQSVLATTRTELDEARARDERMQAALEKAQARLARARVALAEGRAAVEEQGAALRQMAAASYESGGSDLAGLSMLFTTQDPTQLVGGMNSSSSVLNSQSAMLDRLTASRVLLDVQEQERSDAEAEVAKRREEAASNLERKQALEQQAASAADQVAHLVDVKSGARADALAMKQTDIKQRAQLQAEQDRIEALIAQQAAASAMTVPVDGHGILMMPVEGPITSPYGWRIHPIYGYRSLHDGIDIGAGCGTPIVAAADGTVLSEYYSTAWGNRIIVDHGTLKGAAITTISNHLSSYAVSAGAQVKRGEVIGYVGTTGWSTGCHLHFTVMQNGVAVDPMNWF